MKIKLNIYGVKVSVHTDDLGLSKTILSYYDKFVVDGPESVCDIDIHIKKYSYFSKVPDLGVKSKFVTLGDYIKIDFEDKKYYFEDREIKGILDFSDNGKIHIVGFLKPRKLHHIVNMLLQGFVRIHKFYNRFLIKTLIHDMVFILLEKRLGLNLLHATAVTDGKHTLVLTGLGGSGKSTISAFFNKKKKYHILADNYVLIKDNIVYPFPELTRVTDNTFKLLGVKGGKKADGIKRYISQESKQLADTYKVDKIIVCSYGEVFKYEEIKDKERVFEILFSINNYTKEFPEYLNLSLLSFLGQYNTGFDRIKNLKKIADINDVYFLTNSKDDLYDLENLNV